MEKLNIDLQYENLIELVEAKARSRFNIPETKKLESFKLDFKDPECQKVCITLDGEEYCFCL